MKLIIKISAIIFIVFYSFNCSKKQSSSINNDECDTVYVVQYCDSASFGTILQTDTFYQKSKNQYSLKQNSIDVEFWTGVNKSMKRPSVGFYYAKVIGMCNENKFYTSITKHWKYIGNSMVTIVSSKKGIGKSFRTWMDISDYNDSTDAYILTDVNGNQIFHNKYSEQKIKR